MASGKNTPASSKWYFSAILLFGGTALYCWFASTQSKLSGEYRLLDRIWHDYGLLALILPLLFGLISMGAVTQFWKDTNDKLEDVKSWIALATFLITFLTWQGFLLCLL